MATASYSFNRGDETLDVEVHYALDPYPPHDIATLRVERDGRQIALTVEELQALGEWLRDQADKED